MACSNIKKLCDKLVLSRSVTYANNVLTINLPAGAYEDKEKYCIVVAQPIPANTTIVSTVVFTIGTDTTQYPLLNTDCTDVLATQIATRTRYSTKVATNISGGVFRLLGRVGCDCNCCANNNDGAPSLPIQTP